MAQESNGGPAANRITEIFQSLQLEPEPEPLPHLRTGVLESQTMEDRLGQNFVDRGSTLRWNGATSNKVVWFGYTYHGKGTSFRSKVGTEHAFVECRHQ